MTDLGPPTEIVESPTHLAPDEASTLCARKTPGPFRCTVLLVDDERAILNLLADQLKSDFHVLTATTAAEAKSRFAAADVDILVSDLNLPDSTGIQLLDWVRKAAPRTARVLLTGAARMEDTVGAINQSRVHRLILKPWRTEDLINGLRDTARGILLERNHEQLLEEYRKLNAELELRVQERIRAHEQSLVELRMKNQILEKMALTDALTGLPNRRAIDLIARKELLRRMRNPSPLALGLIDADRFKDINGAHTLSGGDHVLVWLGQNLQSAIRATDALARVGGEEFMVVAPATDLAGAERLAERLRGNVARERTSFAGKPIAVTVSAGFAVAEHGEPVNFETMREVAAAALAEAKQTGRNRCVIRKL
jgi:diguanylate cyclase (GGDEF)-like protein